MDSTWDKGTWLRGINAIGICATWMGLVFVGGRIPFIDDFQDFNIMFYNIVKKIFKFILALSFVVMGFGLANMAISCQQSKSIGLRHSFMRALGRCSFNFPPVQK